LFLRDDTRDAPYATRKLPHTKLQHMLQQQPAPTIQYVTPRRVHKSSIFADARPIVISRQGRAHAAALAAAAGKDNLGARPCTHPPLLHTLIADAQEKTHKTTCVPALSLVRCGPLQHSELSTGTDDCGFRTCRDRGLARTPVPRDCHPHCEAWPKWQQQVPVPNAMDSLTCLSSGC